MKLKKLSTFTLSILFLITISFFGCSKKIEYSQINSYSDNTVKSVIHSLTQSNYESFSSLLSDDLRESYDYETFQKESRLFLDNLGTVENIEFQVAEENNGYISAIYNGTFSDEPDNVRISISFKSDDSEHKVYQFYMSSPKITNAIGKN